MPKLNDLTGKKFGRWTVLKKSQSAIHGKSCVKWLCRCDCGVEKEVGGQALTRCVSTSCGCYWKERMTGPNSPRWTTGSHITEDGYVVIANASYPGAKFPNQTKEHIVVMTRHLGRPLYKNETVHHKNGMRADNKLKNLELRASNHGKGQSIPDLIAFAQEVLLRYAPSVLKC